MVFGHPGTTFQGSMMGDSPQNEANTRRCRVVSSTRGTIHTAVQRTIRGGRKIMVERWSYGTYQNCREAEVDLQLITPSPRVGSFGFLFCFHAYLGVRPCSR